MTRSETPGNPDDDSKISDDSLPGTNHDHERLSYSTSMDHLEIFEPYDRLVKVRILGSDRELPENNSILRGLQFLDMERISYGDFCWNGECINCQVWIKNGDKEKAVIACRTNVEEGMEIVRLSDGMEIDDSIE